MAKEKKGLGMSFSSIMGNTFDSDFKNEDKKERITFYEKDITDEDLNQQNVSREKSKIELPDRNEDLDIKEENNSNKVDSTSVIFDSTIAVTNAEELDNVGKLKDINVNLIQPNPDQPRTNFDKEKLDELSESIKKDGVLQPILVRETKDGTYQIVAGERRWQASKLADLKTIPAIITDIDDDKALELALIENIQRDDLNPIEEAYAYKRLMDKLNITQTQLASMMSKGRSTITNVMRLLDLSEKTQEAVFNGEMTAGHARAVLSVPTSTGQEKLTKKIIEEKLTVRDTESLARLLASNPADALKKTKSMPDSYKTFGKQLKSLLETPVKIKTSGGKNRIEIVFKDEEDLERIFNLIND